MGAPATSSAVPGAPDPRLPREPSQFEAPAKPKYPPRKRIPKPARSPDSSDIKAGAFRSEAETTTETPGQKPEAEENSNAQTPIETP
jgi:hypothetical protein